MMKRSIFSIMVAVLLGAIVAHGAVPSYYQEPMEVDEHTFALYRFDEPSGSWTNTTYVDEGTNSLDLTPQWTNPGYNGVYSNSVLFDAGHYASNAHSTVWNTLDSEITIEFWMKMFSEVVNSGSARGIVSKHKWGQNGDDRPFSLYFVGTGSNNTDEISFRWTVRNNNIQTNLVNLGTDWHHFLVNCNGPEHTMEMYLDGNKIQEGALGTSYIPTNDNDFRVGTISGTGGGKYYMDELRISNVARVPKGPPIGTTIIVK